MKQMDFSQWLNSKTITMALLGVLLAYFIITTAIQSRFQEIEFNTRVLIENQESVLVGIAEATARNGADSVTESIVKDCALKERSSFEDLLSRLDDGLSLTQLTELERLFGRCGSFYSERKAVMVAKLVREIEVYETYIQQLNLLTSTDESSNYSLEQWNALAAEEKKKSDLFAELVRLQDEIISTLLSGKNAASPEIIEILQQVKEVQETLVVASKQASAIRDTLVTL